MRQDIFFDSKGAGQIHACIWQPEETPRAVVQIVHGIAEHVRRYDEFAAFLNANGIAVVAEDHMGHGASIGKNGIQGYFHGGWFTAVEDTVQLMLLAKERFGEIPYILFGHSMGSFMARTILARYPEHALAGCVICGTGWQPQAVLSAGIAACKLICRTKGANKPSELLQGMIFGAYNKRVEHPASPYDWLSRDAGVVDNYLADPLCGFTATAGLMRDMLIGIDYIQKKENLAAMKKKLPCLFIAGGDDPVGAYGKGVRQASDAFQDAGMEQVKTKIYPLCRHELLNEINRQEIYRDILKWAENLL